MSSSDLERQKVEATAVAWRARLVALLPVLLFAAIRWMPGMRIGLGRKWRYSRRPARLGGDDRSANTEAIQRALPARPEAQEERRPL